MLYQRSSIVHAGRCCGQGYTGEHQIEERWAIHDDTIPSNILFLR